jgi:hypothetical protein
MGCGVAESLFVSSTLISPPTERLFGFASSTPFRTLIVEASYGAGAAPARCLQPSHAVFGAVVLLSLPGGLGLCPGFDYSGADSSLSVLFPVYRRAAGVAGSIFAGRCSQQSFSHRLVIRGCLVRQPEETAESGLRYGIR